MENENVCHSIKILSPFFLFRYFFRKETYQAILSIPCVTLCVRLICSVFAWALPLFSTNSIKIKLYATYPVVHSKWICGQYLASYVKSLIFTFHTTYIPKIKNIFTAKTDYIKSTLASYQDIKYSMTKWNEENMCDVCERNAFFSITSCCHIQHNILIL